MIDWIDNNVEITIDNVKKTNLELEFTWDELKKSLSNKLIKILIIMNLVLGFLLFNKYFN